MLQRQFQSAALAPHGHSSFLNSVGVGTKDIDFSFGPFELGSCECLTISKVNIRTST